MCPHKKNFNKTLGITPEHVIMYGNNTEGTVKCYFYNFLS